ncbi:MAG: hypothetical protein EOM64_07085 [Erysipelotrichia bacterium]|nr:hypothetical protein [Erysipelotrichia bacterium]
MSELKRANSKHTEVCFRIMETIMLVTSVVFIALGVCGLSVTWTFDPSRHLILEHLISGNDYVLLNIGFLIMFTALYLLLEVRMPGYEKKIRFYILIPCVLGIIGLCGYLWVLDVVSVPSTDSAKVYMIASELASGNTSILSQDIYNYYLVMHPYQLGTVALLEMILLLFPSGSYIGPQLVNVTALLIAYCGLYMIVWQLTSKSRKALFLSVILSLFSVQAIFFCTFVYGNLCSFACSVWSIFFLIRWLKIRKGMIFCLLLLSMSVVMKANAWITAIAFCIVLLLVMLQSRNPKIMIAAGLSLLLPWCSQRGIQKYYEQISGVAFGNGLSSRVWLAIGMNVSTRAPGWYSEIPPLSNTSLIQDATIGETETAAETIIQERLSLFRRDPLYALSFYAKKITSEWEEPTYECFWLSEVRRHGAEITDLANEIYYGGTRVLLQEWMDVSADGRYFFGGLGMLALYIRYRKKRKQGVTEAEFSAEAAYLILPLILFGGFLYHAIYEAKSQYLLIYYLYLIPLSAWSMTIVGSKFMNWVRIQESGMEQ